MSTMSAVDSSHTLSRDTTLEDLAEMFADLETITRTRFGSFTASAARNAIQRDGAGAVPAPLTPAKRIDRMDSAS